MSIPLAATPAWKTAATNTDLHPCTTLRCASHNRLRGQTVNQLGKVMQPKWNDFFARLVPWSALAYSCFSNSTSTHRGVVQNQNGQAPRTPRKPTPAEKRNAHRRSNRGQLGWYAQVQWQSTTSFLQKYEVNIGIAHLDSAHIKISPYILLLLFSGSLQDHTVLKATLQKFPNRWVGVFCLISSRLSRSLNYE